MSKLDPLPKPIYPIIKEWDYINKFLKRSFPEQRTSQGKFGVYINLREYKMSKVDIVAELKKIDLVVTDGPNDNILVEEKHGN